MKKENNGLNVLLKKYSHDEWMQKTIEYGYGKRIVEMEEGGSIDFDPDGMKTVVKGERLSYNDYLDAQIQSLGHTHSGFQQCFYNCPLEFKGQIERIAKDSRVIFKRIYICGMYPDGVCFENKEDHVWMARQGFETLQAGDCVSFQAEPYRYLKTGKGKHIDYAIRNPSSVKIINQYDLPTDDELLWQEIDLLACEMCYLYDNCSGLFCPLERQKRAFMQDAFTAVKPKGQPDSRGPMK